MFEFLILILIFFALPSIFAVQHEHQTHSSTDATFSVAKTGTANTSVKHPGIAIHVTLQYMNNMDAGIGNKLAFCYPASYIS